MTSRLKKNQSTKTGIGGGGVASQVPTKPAHELQLKFRFHYHII